MTAYGQSLTPKTFQRTLPQAYTKLGYAELLARALAAVGMQQIESWNPYDILDTANSEKAVGSTYNSNFFFDFPMTDTFAIGPFNYRPCICLVAAINADGSAANNGVIGEGIGFRLGYRRADRTMKSDFKCYAYYRAGTSNYGVGNHGDGVNPYYTPMEAGGYYFKYDWAPYATFGNALYSNLYVTNTFVHLGPAGLFVFMGTGTSRLDFGNLLSMGVLFAGARISGRARSPSSDTNLNRINPTYYLPMFTTDSEFISGSFLTGQIMGMGHDLKYTQEPIMTELYNFENVDQPLYVSTSAPSLRSPRSVSGVGCHILNIPVIVTRYRRGNVTDLYGPVDTQITSSETRPQWEDLWTAPGFRLVDRTAPVGEYTDPVTGKKWFLVYAQNTNMVYGLSYDGRVIVADPITLSALTLQATMEYNLNNGFTTGLPDMATAVSHFTIGTGDWTAGPTDDMVRANPGSTSLHGFTITFDPADGGDAIYRLSFQVKAEKGSGTSAFNFNFYNWTTGTVNPTTLTGAVTLLTVAATVGAGFTTYEIEIHPHETTPNTIVLGFELNHSTGTTTGQSVDVRDPKIKRYRRP